MSEEMKNQSAPEEIAERDKRNEAFMKKKQAEMEHAENYRRKLREEKERARALAAKRKANRMKAEAERKQREEEIAARENAKKEGEEEARRRNAESDHFLDRAEAKTKENDQLIQDMEDARAEAIAKAEAEIEAIRDSIKAQSAPKAAAQKAPEAPIAKNTPSPKNEELSDFVITFDDEDNALAKDKSDDNKFTVNFDDVDAKIEMPKEEKKAKKQANPASQPMPEAQPMPTAPVDPVQAYLFASPTYKQIQKNQFGKNSSVKRAKDNSHSDVTEVSTTFNPNKQIQKSDSNNGYRFASARELDVPMPKQKKAKTPKTSEGMGESDDESNLDPSLNAVSAVGAAGAITAALAIGAKASSDKEQNAAPTADDLTADIENANNLGEENSDMASAAAVADAEALSDEIEIGNKLGEYTKDNLSEEIKEANNASKKDAADEEKLGDLKQTELSDAIDNANASSEKSKLDEDEKSELKHDGLSEELKDANDIAQKINDEEELKKLGKSIYSDKDYDPALFDENGSYDAALAAVMLSAPAASYLASTAKDSKRFKNLNEEYQKFLIEKEAAARENHYEWGGEISAIHLKECADIEKLLLESYTENYRVAAKHGDEAAMKKYLNKAQGMVDEYNLDMALFGALTNTKNELIPEAYMDNLIEGCDLPEIPVADIPEEILNRIPEAKEKYARSPESADTSSLPATIGEIDAFNKSAAKKALLTSETEKILKQEKDGIAPTRRDVDKYFEHASKYNQELIAKEARVREMQSEAIGDMSVIYLKECMDIERELLSSYTDNYLCALEVNDSFLAKNYKNKLSSLIDEYNIDLSCWTDATDAAPKVISKSCLNDKESVAGLKEIEGVELPESIKNAARQKRVQYQKQIIEASKAAIASDSVQSDEISSEESVSPKAAPAVSYDNDFDIFEVFLTAAAVKSMALNGEDRDALMSYERSIDDRRRKLDREKIADDAAADTYEAALLKADIKAYKEITAYEVKCLKKHGADKETIREHKNARQQEFDALSEHREELIEAHNDKKNYVEEAEQANNNQERRRSLGDAKHIGQENENSAPKATVSAPAAPKEEEPAAATVEEKEKSKSASSSSKAAEAQLYLEAYASASDTVNEAIYEAALLKRDDSALSMQAKELQAAINVNQYEKALDKDKSEMLPDGKKAKKEVDTTAYDKKQASDKSELTAVSKQEKLNAAVAAYDAALAKDKSEMLPDGQKIKKEVDTTAYDKKQASDKSELAAVSKQEKLNAAVAAYDAALAKDKSEMLPDGKEFKKEIDTSAYDKNQAAGRDELLAASKTVKKDVNTSHYDASVVKKSKSEMITDAKAYRSDLETALYHAAMLKDKSSMLADGRSAKKEINTSAYDKALSVGGKEMLADANLERKADNLDRFDLDTAKRLKKKEYKTIASVSVEELEVFGAFEKYHSKKQLLRAAKEVEYGNVIRLYQEAMMKKSEKLLQKDDKKQMALDYERTMLLAAYDKSQQKKYEGADNSSQTKEMRDALISDAINQSDRDAIIALANRDLRRFLDKSAKREKKLTKQKNEAHKKYLKASLGTAKIYLRECIEAEHQLLQSYVDDFTASLCVRNPKYITHFDKKVTIEAEAYRSSLELWKSRTGEAVPYISKTLTEDIKNGEASDKILTIEPKKQSSVKLLRKQKNKDLLKFAKEEEKREEKLKIRELELMPVKNYDGGEIWITEAHMKTDLDATRAKIEHRTDRYVNYLELHTLRFGTDTPRDKKTFKERLKKLSQMRRGKKPLIKYTKNNNKRLLAIAQMDLTRIDQTEVKKERIEELHNRILSLLIERDEINLKLLPLYADENSKKHKKKNHKKRIANVRLKASKRAFKKQVKLYKIARKYRVPETHKDRIFAVMNKKIELRAYLAECKYRKRTEKPTARKAKKVLRKKIKDTKLRMKYAERDFDKFMTKAGKRSRRTPDPKKQFFWSVVLILMVAAGVAAFFMFKDNKELVMGYAKAAIKKVFSAISGIIGK